MNVIQIRLMPLNSHYFRFSNLIIHFKYTIMTIVGRITKDAVVAQMKDERQVVNFSVALNDFYKKNGEAVKLTTFINCSYWMNSN